MNRRKRPKIESHAASSGMSILLGVTWYRREDWPRLMQLFPDRHIMHASFDDWLHDAEKMEQQVKARSGVSSIKRIILDPDELMAWCNARGRKPDAEARAQYVTEKTRNAAAAKGSA